MVTELLSKRFQWLESEAVIRSGQGKAKDVSMGASRKCFKDGG